MLPWLARHDRARRSPAATCSGSSCRRRSCCPVGRCCACFAGPIVAPALRRRVRRTRRCRSRCSGRTIALYGLQTLSATLLIARDSPGRPRPHRGRGRDPEHRLQPVAIPLWGADGAAGVALSSVGADGGADDLGRRPAHAAGSRRSGRSAAPLLAGAALVAVALLAPLPTLPAAIARAARLRRRAGRDRARPAPRRRAHLPARATAAGASVQTPARSSSGLTNRTRLSSCGSP